MRDYLRKLKPEVFEDLIAMNALYRPGPMDWIDDFIARKHGRKAIEYMHPMLEPILKETYGIIVYQEQVMRIASVMAGFSMGKADLLRRAMGKKKAELMAEQRALFLEGAAKNNIPEKLANEIFDMMDKFAGYGFVKPHSTCYALVAFQTAYLKKHYPAEFMAAAISSEMGSTNRVVILIEECKRMGITIKPPDVNESAYDFKVDNGDIRFGLGAIKNVGKNAIESIIASRNESGKFTNLFEFCERIDSRLVNKKVLESLIQSGALDSLEGHRAQKLQAIETAISFAQSANAERVRGQTSLFGGEEDDTPHYPMLPYVTEWNNTKVLALEKEMLGFYVSGHPLDKYRNEVKTFSTIPLNTINSCSDGTEVRVCGIVQDCKSILDRKNKPMAFVTLEDFYGTVEVVVFSSVYEKYRDLLTPDSMVAITGRANAREEEQTKILCENVSLLENAWEDYGKNLHLGLKLIGVDDPLLNQVSEILKRYPGSCNLFINLRTSQQKDKTIKSRKMKVRPSLEMITQDKICDVIKQVLFQPKEALAQMKTKDINISESFKEYILILAAIPSLSMFIGLIGRVNERGESISLGANLIFSVLLFAVLVLGVLLSSKIINFLAPYFSSTADNNNAFKLSFYSFVPAFAAGIFNINPSLSFLWFLGSLYGCYIFYLGAPVLMETTDAKRISYTVVTAIVIYVVMITLFKVVLSLSIGASLPSFR